MARGTKVALIATAVAASTAMMAPRDAAAAEWSQTELHFQYGKLDNPFTGTKDWTPILTVEHMSGYSWGDIYFFIDGIDDGTTDGFNDKDAYGEVYAFFSSAKLLGAQYNGLVKDVGAFTSINYGADSGYLAYLVGAYVDWNVKGFSFLRSYVAARFDDSDFNEQNGWHADVWWNAPFEIGSQRFSFLGHFEYMSQERNDFGPTHDWWLAQPQLRWDAGYAFTGKKDVFFLGTEYQLWINKLGSETDESAFQALAVWRF